MMKYYFLNLAKNYFMKRILLFTIFIFTVILSNSQNSLDITGDSIVYGDPSQFQLEAALSVKNISSNIAIVYCEKNVIQQNQTGTNDFCWAGTCYGASTLISTKADTINPGDKLGSTSVVFFSINQSSDKVAIFPTRGIVIGLRFL